MLQRTILLAEPELLKFKWVEVPITQAPKLRKKSQPTKMSLKPGLHLPF